MKNILITGGAGFIGSNLANKLVELGYIVTVLDNLSPQIHGEYPTTSSPLYSSLPKSVVFIKGSVTNREDLLKSMKHQDAIIHLAAETGTGQSMYEVQRYVDVNIGGTGIMLDILANTDHHVKKVIVASSRAIYGEGKYRCEEHGVIYPLKREEKNMSLGDFSCKCPVCAKSVELLSTSEDSKIHPTSVYGITKQNQEQMIMTVCDSLKIPAVAFRYQNVYGPGQSLSNPYTGILSIFSTRIRGNKGINIFEDGRESRDFVYIDDVVNATILGLEKKEANGQSFNVGTGIATDVSYIARTLCRYYGMNVPLDISGNYRIGDIRHNYADITKIKEMVGFEPRITLKEGLLQFTNWVTGQNILDDEYEKSILEMKQKGLYK